MHFLTRLALGVVLVVPGAAPAQQQQVAPQLAAEAWREDLRVLATELPNRHRNAFARMKRESWDSAVAALDARIPQMRGYEVEVALARLVALVNDGHTTLAPDGEERMAFGRLPIELYDFSDGMYVVAADSAHANLVGARVVKIGGMPIAAAMDSASHVVSHEGPHWVRLRAPSMLVIPEVLAALHMGDSARASFTLDRGGVDRVVTLSATRKATNVIPVYGTVPAGWLGMADALPGERPIWMQHPEETAWFTMLPDRTLYIGYRAVGGAANGETNEAFFHRAFAAGDSAHADRVVLDIRSNGGGNNYLNRFVVREIVQRPALDQRTHAFVIIGRNTFSAAQSLVNELSYYTNATFVGEPTGNAPNQYGDNRALELPHSHLRVRISSLLWESHQATDQRTSFPPTVSVELSSDDFRLKRDPVLAAALGYAGEPPLTEKLAAEALSSDSGAVVRYIETLRSNPANRYRPLEQEVNVSGYDLFRSGRTAQALVVFRANTALFPSSANAFDSLGEALEAAGKRDAAIAAYRRAVAIDAGMVTSREALRRLGAS
jgi:Peptidase family S41